MMINNGYILLFMIFCHIIDDYCLQAFCLASLKQKKYWKENAPQPKYKYDYIVALLMHAFSWSFMIHLPIILNYNFMPWIAYSVIINTLIHAIVDNLKANKMKLNLIQDQLIHIIQIIVVFIIFKITI